MSELVEIQEVREVDSVELDARLRSVSLKGFPDVKIYADSDISIQAFSPEQIKRRVFTPQPRVYRSFIDRINRMAGLFAGKGVDIFRLTEGWDYVAIDDAGQATNWTIIPPVVELVDIGFTGRGLDYSRSISPELKARLDKEGHKVNPALESLWFPEFEGYRGVNSVLLINDGSNRVHAALEKGIEQHLLVMNAPKTGYPYYAAPKPYSTVHIERERTGGDKSDKTHILSEPGHKLLYRLFPSGGIHSGDVRPDHKPSS